MRVFRARVYDGNEDYRTYVGVGEEEEMMSVEDCNRHLKKFGLSDEDIHFYFTNEEWEEELIDGFIETYDKELKYKIFGEVEEK